MGVSNFNSLSKKVSPIAGGGVLNNIIDKLGFELHIPGYNFCGK